MKKLLTLSLIAAAFTFASCGGGNDAEKAKQDSIKVADSLAKVKATEDSVKVADSLAQVKAKEDSIKKADSMKKCDKASATKTVKKVVKKTEEQKTTEKIVKGRG
ncbi:MAG: hypothetical protein PHD97_05205 [Bacteroidales bacterium]|nr:hypothetical protein [Bacteroidales bacterium]